MANSNSGDEAKKYFRVEKMLLKFAGISLTEDVGVAYKIYSAVCLFVLSAPFPFIISVDLITQKFNEVLDSWFITFGTFLALCVTLTTYRNRIKLGKMLNRLEEAPFLANTERGGKVEEDLIQRWYNFSHLQGIVFVIGVCLSIFSQMIYTMTKRIMTSDSSQWSIGFAKISVINITYSPNFELAWVYQNVSLFYLGANTCCTSLIISGVLAHVGTQFKMLQNNLRRMIYNSQQKMLKDRDLRPDLKANIRPSDIPWKYLQESVKETVDYHLKIIEISGELEDFFSVAMLVVYSFTLAMVCVEVYRASLLPPNDFRTLRILLETATASFHAGIMCFSGDEMAHESELVAKAAYEAEFVGVDRRFQKSLVIIIRRGQETVRIKAGKLIDTSVVTFMGILRTSYSVYMVLRNTNMQ